jgi:hypothetical protein
MVTILEKLHELGKMVSEMNSYKVDPSAVEWIRGLSPRTIGKDLDELKLSPRDHRRVMDLFTTIHTSGLFVVASRNPRNLDGTWGKACYNIYASQYPDLVNAIAVLPDIPFRMLLQEVDKCITEVVKNVG